MTVIDNNGQEVFLNHIKPASNYTTEEINYFLELPLNSFEYDYLIDRLYFYSDSNVKVKRKNRLKYEVLTAREMQKKRKREIPYWDESWGGED